MSKTLVAYFSHAGENYVSGNIETLERGNAERLAVFAARACEGVLFEIKRAEPYPTVYQECVDAASAELKAAARPSLASDFDPAPYDKIVLIYPNWCGTMPMPVYTWLEAHDFAGKTICPVCTHEGSGLAETEQDIARVCPGATVTGGLAVKGSEAAESEDAVLAWLG